MCDTLELIAAVAWIISFIKWAGSTQKQAAGTNNEIVALLGFPLLIAGLLLIGWAAGEW